MRLELESRGERVTVDARRDGDRIVVTLSDGSEHAAEVERLADGTLLVRRETGAARAATARTGRDILVSFAGRTWTFSPVAAAAPRGGGAGSGRLVSPMPGVVHSVYVEQGQAVEAGQAVAVVEAMKVMATLEAPFAGVVRALNAAQGNQVKQGELLAEIEPLPQESTGTGRVDQHL
jgi:biotin carboxyl carrier protein